ncbi:MAG: hypothetical protein KC492_23105, partial [Myxococcales bacterium]|nr:hypothetical protein [Myxococcales bacterium]
MSDYQARIALARDAYQATQPTAQQLAAGTVRVQAQLANPANHMRRLLQFLGGGALLGAGLFAAVSSTPNEGVQAAALGSVGQTEAAPSQPSAGSAKLGLPQGWLQPMQVDSDAPSADVGTAGPAAAVPPEVRG